jgi:protein SCO1
VNPRYLIALVLTAVFALGAVVVVAVATRGGGEDDPAGSGFEGSVMPEGLRAPDFELTNQDGKRVRMSDLRGGPVIVTFLYTNCDDTCPPQAQQIKGALNELGHDVPAVAVAVDPPRDTPASARKFLAEARMAGRMEFLVGDRRALEPVWKGFAIQPQAGNAEHQARITLVDAKGFQRVGFPLGQTTPERIAHDVRLLENGA